MNHDLLDKIGGELVLGQVVELFYNRVLQDSLLIPFFEKVEMESQKKKLHSLFRHLFNGSLDQYGRLQLQQIHAHLNIKSSHFNAFIGHMEMSLEELLLPQSIVDEVIDKMIDLKEEIMYYNPDAKFNTTKTEVMLDTNVNIYELLLQAAADAVVVIDENKKIIFWNKSSEKLWGYTSAETLGQNINNFVPDQHKKAHDGYIDANIRTGVDKIVGVGREEELQRKDGSKVPVLLTMSKVKENDKTYFMAFVKDITAQKEAAKNMEVLKNTVDNSFARIEFDTEGYVLDVNQNFVKTLGYHSANEILGKHHSIFVEDTYKTSADYAQFWRNLGSGVIQDGEFKRMSKQGQPVWIQAVYTPVKDESGQIIKVIKIAIDITAQKRLLLDINKVIVLAGEQGKLDAKIDTSSASGDWKALGDSVNLLLKSVANPVFEINRVVQHLAKGNLTERFELNAEGDIKSLGNSLNEAIENMTNLLTQISQISNLVAASAEEMLAKGEDMKKTTQEVASATQQMAEGTQQQAQQTDEASKMIDEVLKSAVNMASKAVAINKAADQGQKNATEGLSTIKQVSENMFEIQESAKSTSKSIEVLSERSEEIASALSVITDIASQTNLLALNAAIEAARAGDAGRGFAVVAEEIRKLAEGSRKSAIDIEKVIKEVHKDITAAAKAIANMEASVKSGTAAGKEAQEVLENIEKTSSDTLSLSKEIVEVTDDQKEAINTTAQNIEKIVVVAEETASGTEQIASSGKVLSQGMNEVTATSEDLANVANQLQDSISKFKLKK